MIEKMLLLPVNKYLKAAYQEKKFTLAAPLAMLVSRIVLFAVFQGYFCLVFLLAGAPQPWAESAKYWPYVVCLANIVCVFALDRLYRREGTRFLDFFRFHKGTVLKDFLTTSGVLILSMPLAYFPNMLLGTGLYGNYNDAVFTLYQPLPFWAAIGAVILFPLTMPLGELTTYFGYVMPRLELTLKSKAWATILPAVALSVQHMFLPLIFDGRFILWRAFMFLPFAFIVALLVRWRPRLLPYMLIGHVLIDVMTAITYLTLPMA